MMNNTNVLLLDRPITNSSKSISYHSKNRNFDHRSNFYHVLSNQVDSQRKDALTNFSNGIRQLKKTLNQIKSPSEELTSVIEDLKKKLSENASIAELVEFDETVIHKLLLAFVGNNPSFMEEEITEEQIFQLIDELFLNDLNSKVEEIKNYQSVYLINDSSVNGLSEGVLVLIQQLMQQITEVLSQISADDKSFSNISSRLLSLLEQWSQLSKDGKLSLTESLKDSVSEKELKLWEKLSTIFNKRIAQQNKGTYRSEATVTSKDIAKWLETLMSETVENKGQAITTSYQDLGRQMTQIEQYIVHVQSSDRVEKVSQELIQKMTQIIQQSQFTKPGSQIQQLSLMIRPENLGNMTLHFTQMNGDIVVKIIVSSQMAREMLESNIHQLKHLFAPHQVVIERDTTISDEQFFNQDYEEEHSEHEESMNETKDERHHHDDENEQIDFESLLQMTAEGG